MAVIGNTMTEIGDVMIVVSSPILGLTAISGHTITINGITGSRTCSTEFSYSYTGMYWSPWVALDNPNLSSIPFNQAQPLVIRLRLTRGGVDSTGIIEFVDFVVSGTYSSTTNNSMFYSSIFSQFFGHDDQDHVDWATNMFQKYYSRGIIPSYITRAENSNEYGEDNDYISLWMSVSSALAWNVVYARTLTDVTDREDLMYDYLSDRGMGLCASSDMYTMIYIMANYYDEIRKRGTKFVFEKANTLGTNPVAGEFLRLICNRPKDEYAYTISDRSSFGWVLGESSPMYTGTGGDVSLIRGYEPYEDVIDGSLYPIIGSGNVFDHTDGSKQVLKIPTVNSGIGYSGTGVPDKLIVIDSAVNYEITFDLKFTDIHDRVYFGVDFFDKDLNLLSSLSIDGSNSFGYFSQNIRVGIIDTYYRIRGIIFGVNEPIRSGTNGVTLDTGNGKHIKTPCGAVYIVPKITYKIGSGSGAFIHDFKVRIADTPYSRCFIQTPNSIQVWAKNNNGLYQDRLTNLTNVSHPISNQDAVQIPLLEHRVRQYLIPYDCMIVFNWLGNTNVCP